MNVRFVAIAVTATLASAACGVSVSPMPDGRPGASARPMPDGTPGASATRSLAPPSVTSPPNDDPPGITITVLPFSDTTSTTEAGIDAMEGELGCGPGHQSVWYSFTATADQNLIADTLGSDYDTIIDVWKGALTSGTREFSEWLSLIGLACNDNSGSSLQSEVAFAAVIGQRYVIRVTTACVTTGTMIDCTPRSGTGGILTFHLLAASSSPTATPQPTPFPVPPKPTGVTFDEQVRVSDDESVLEITQTVTWGAPWSEGVEIRVYGVTDCIAEPADPPPGTSGPCLVVHTPLPASVRTLLATAPASDGAVSWTWWQESGDCDIGNPAYDRDGPAYYAVVLAAYGASGHSIFVIAEPGGWWRAAPGDIYC